jgi:hypothetical protein
VLELAALCVIAWFVIVFREELFALLVIGCVIALVLGAFAAL